MSEAVASESRTPGFRRIWLVGSLTLALLTPFVGMAQDWNARLQSYWFDAFQRIEPRTVQSMPAVVVECGPPEALVEHLPELVETVRRALHRWAALPVEG